MQNGHAELIVSNAISRQEYEKTRHRRADHRRRPAAAQETVNEVEATLDWATIRSPFDGTVIDKKVDVGDMVTPGQTLAHALRS